MATDSERNDMTWVEDRLAKLEPDPNWRPDAARARARLQQHAHRNGAVRAWIWAAVAVTAGTAGLMAFSYPRTVAQRCVNACESFLGLSAAPTAPSDGTAPDFRLRDAGGAVVRLSDYKGKVVLLNFWATWCGPCQVEIPWFVEFERDYRAQGFEVIGVSMDEDGWKAVRPYVEAHKMNYRVALGDDELGQKYGGVELLPITFVIDRRGHITSRHVGLVSKDKYEQEIVQMLKEN